MADETNEFNLDGYNIGMNDDTGELEIGKIEPSTDTTKTPVDAGTTSIEQPQVPVDQNYSVLQNQISQLTNHIANQNNAIKLLLQAQAVQLQQPEQSLGEEQDRLVETITRKVAAPIQQLQNQINPYIQQQQIEQQTQQEYQHFISTTPDAGAYIAGMQQVFQAMPNKNWTYGELYVIAKGMGLKAGQQTQNNQQQNQQNNVTDINQGRNLPQRTQSTNTQLQSKEIRPGKEGLRDALNQAIEELGFGT